jgi:AAA family ATP:ADP antiporter
MNLPVLFVSMSLLKALTYSINDPAKEILYIPTSNAVKFKAKFWIDVVGARVAKAIGSSINTYAGTAERIVTYGSLPSVITAITLWVVCFSVGMEFDGLLENNYIIGIEEDDEQCVSYDSIDSEENHGSFSETNHVCDDSGWESNVSIELVPKTR